MADLGAVKRTIAELESKGQIENAVAELEKAIQDFPKEGSLYNKLGDLYIKVKRRRDALDIYEQGAKVFKDETYYPNAIALCKKILRLDKNRAEVYKILGELHKELDQRGEAANYFLEYAECKMRKNDMESALKTYSMIKELVPNNPKILETISAIYEQVGKKEEGEELLKEAHDLEQKQEKLRQEIGVDEKPEVVQEAVAEKTEEQKGEPITEEKEDKTEVGAEETVVESEVELEQGSVGEEQEEIVEAAVEEEMEENSPEELISPEVAELLSDDTKAEVENEVVAEEAPTGLSDIDKTIELGELYLNLGSEDEAIDCFRGAAHEAWEEKDYNTALTLNQKIAQLRPFDLKSRKQMIEIAQTMGDTALHIKALLDLAESLNRREVKGEARDVYKQVLEIDPENATAQEMLAAIEEPKDFIDLGAVLRTEMADDHRPGVPQSMQDLISQFRQQVFESVGEGDHHSRYDLGVAYKGMGLYQEAIEEFEIAAKDATLKLKALEMISSCFLERGKIDEAVRTLEEGLRVTDRPKREFFGIHFLLGQCYEKKEQMREALKQYLTAYRIDKSVPDLTHRMNELKRKFEAELKTKRKKAARKKTEERKAQSGVRKIETKKSKITYL